MSLSKVADLAKEEDGCVPAMKAMPVIAEDDVCTVCPDDGSDLTSCVDDIECNDEWEYLEYTTLETDYAIPVVPCFRDLVQECKAAYDCADS